MSDLTECDIGAASSDLPRLSNQVQFGPTEFFAGRTMRLGKNVGTGKYFRLGEREVFLLQLLDGSRTSGDIIKEYAAHFGKRLTEQSLRSALALFSARGLLDGQPVTSPQQLETTAIAPVGAMPGLFSKKLLFWSPDERLTKMIPYCRWFINGPSFALWSLLILAFEGLILANRTQLWQDFTALSPATWVLRGAAIMIVSSFVMTFHEFGHGLACKRYGGEVQEMGYLFRYLSFCAYTRIDDILLFHKRRERIYVLLIGPLISLSVIPLAFALWFYTPASSNLHIVACDVLIWYNINCLIQLIPLLQFDGYFMLAQLLRAPDLRKDSYNYVLQWLLRGFRSRPPLAADCPAHLVRTYIFYGLFSAVFSSLAIGYILRQYGESILHSIGLVPSLAVLCIALAAASWRIWSVTVPWIRKTYQQSR